MIPPTDAPPERDEKRSPPWRDIVRILVFTGVFALLAILVRNPAIEHYFDVAVWREMLQRGNYVGGPLSAVLLFGLAGAVAIAMGTPRIWVAALFGAIYGALVGSILAIASAILGTSVVYYAGRHFLRGVVQRRVGGRLETWRRRFRENAFWWVLYARLFPFANSSVTSLACGACEVPFPSYVLASLFGFIPYTVVFAMFGSGGAKANAWQIAVGFALMVLVFLSRSLFRRAARPTGGPTADLEGRTH